MRRSPPLVGREAARLQVPVVSLVALRQTSGNVRCSTAHLGSMCVASVSNNKAWRCSAFMQPRTLMIEWQGPAGVCLRERRQLWMHVPSLAERTWSGCGTSACGTRGQIPDRVRRTEPCLQAIRGSNKAKVTPFNRSMRSAKGTPTSASTSDQTVRQQAHIQAVPLQPVSVLGVPPC
jgi:hypothetical protein